MRHRGADDEAPQPDAPSSPSGGSAVNFSYTDAGSSQRTAVGSTTYNNAASGGSTRYYNTHQRTLNQQDISSGNPNNPQTLRYTYAADNPVNFVDPTGMCSGFFGCIGSAVDTVGKAINTGAHDAVDAVGGRCAANFLAGGILITVGLAAGGVTVGLGAAIGITVGTALIEQQVC